MSLVNDPVPVPSVVLVGKATVGFADVFQHTPLTVTAEPPPDVKLPPLEAVIEVMEDGVVVATAGRVVSS